VTDGEWCVNSISAHARHATARSELSPSVLASLLMHSDGRAALVIAHPAHEIRLHHWMKRARPATYILTSGSRSGNDRTRLEASAKVIELAGAQYVDHWGAMQDKTLYRQILDGDASHLVTLTRLLADNLIAFDASIVVTDSWQEYNVAHDLTHVITRRAAALAANSLGRALPVVDYPVVPYRLVPNAVKGDTLLDLRLNDQECALKDAAVRSIPLIAQEVDEIVAAEGADAFSAEQFNAPLPLRALTPGRVGKPYYEEFGEQRVRSGVYMDVIRARHMNVTLTALIESTHITHD
jgi:hypothetical protein